MKKIITAIAYIFVFLGHSLPIITKMLTDNAVALNVSIAIYILGFFGSVWFLWAKHALIRKDSMPKLPKHIQRKIERASNKN